MPIAWVCIHYVIGKQISGSKFGSVWIKWRIFLQSAKCQILKNHLKQRIRDESRSNYIKFMKYSRYTLN